MTDPLIVVEGSLRLPSLRPLADPRFKFGREWSITHNRPLLAQSEFKLYGATFETAYVKPFSLADAASRYRPLSIWATLTEKPARRSMFGFSRKKDSAPVSQAGNPAKVEPIQLNVATPAKPEKLEFRFPNALKAAIALACAAFAAWVVYTHQQHTSDGAHSFEGVQSSNTLPFVTPAVAATTRADESPDALVNVSDKAAARQAPLTASAPVQASAPVRVASLPDAKPAPRRLTKPAAHRAMRMAKWTRHTAAHGAKSRRRGDAYFIARPMRVPSGAMSTEALYSMLQHSPTLDSNVGTGAVRANGAQ